MEHQYLVYERPKAGRLVAREMAHKLFNAYLGTDHSITKLRKLPPTKIGCKDYSSGATWTSKPISYEIVLNFLEENGRFDSKPFDLFEVKCNWLDGETNVSLPQQIVGSNNDTVKFHLPLPLGSAFPIQPMLDREGVLYNSLQNSLTKRIITLHKRLVASSNSFNSDDWLYDLITLFSNSVSLVDITLNQFHIKAEYDPLPSWTFDPLVVGSRINRRMEDKFHWVKRITGNPLDNVESELKAFKILKNLRNHTQHFDPPCFGFSLEESTDWMNLVPKIALLLIKIRKKIGSKLNDGLVELALLPTVEFVGITTFDRARVAPIGVGYQTTMWK